MPGNFTSRNHYRDADNCRCDNCVHVILTCQSGVPARRISTAIPLCWKSALILNLNRLGSLPKGRLSRPACRIASLPGCHSGGGKVSNHNRSGRKPAGPFNWLEWLDRKAARLPRATGWTSPDEPFMLARYPHLRPAPIPGDVHSRIMCESEEKTAAQQFAEWESRIAHDREAAACLKGLNAKRRTQLAALLLQTIVEFEMGEADSRSSQWRRHLRRAPGRLRKLNRKLQKARQAVEELRACAQDSGAEGPNDMARRWAWQLLGFNYRLAADK